MHFVICTNAASCVPLHQHSTPKKQNSFAQNSYSSSLSTARQSPAATVRALELRLPFRSRWQPREGTTPSEHRAPFDRLASICLSASRVAAQRNSRRKYRALRDTFQRRSTAPVESWTAAPSLSAFRTLSPSLSRRRSSRCAVPIRPHIRHVWE